MRIFRYLMNFKAAVAATLALLVVLVLCDLMLPRLTSQIVDVGIQQAGVEHVAVDEMRASTFDAVCSSLPADEADGVRASYDRSAQGTYVLNDKGRADRAVLDRILAAPLAAVHGMGTAESGAADPSGSGLFSQQAIQAAIAEYEALGRDMTGMQIGYVLKVGAAMMGLAVCSLVLNIVIALISSRTGAKLGRMLRYRLFSKVVSFSDADVQRFSAASLITRGTNDIQQIQHVSIMMMNVVFYAPVMALGGIVMVLRTNVAMGWIVVVAVVCVFALVMVLMRITMPKFRIMQKLIDRVNLVSREMLTGMPVIRAFDRQQHEEARFEAASADLMGTQLFTSRAMSSMMPAMSLVMNAVSVLIVWVGARYIDIGIIQTGDLIAFITYSMLIIMAFLMIGMIAVTLPRANVAAQRVEEVLCTRPSVADPACPRDDQLQWDAPGASVEFQGVSFRYAGAGDNVLDDVSFTVQPGETCAIIGPTGSGKSTIVKLIERFSDATEGSVRVDGIDVRGVSQEALRRTVAYVPQKAFLFSGTIGDTIAYAGTCADGTDIDEGRVAEAARIAQASDFIAEKDLGMDSPLAQGGTNVSGGQRQRLAIARALATDARVLLFDDSFSALDYKTDAALRGALAASMAGKTIIVVAQRIATVMGADQIIVLDDGRIAGKGTHGQLLASCPAYREIAESQLSPEELAGGAAR